MGDVAVSESSTKNTTKNHESTTSITSHEVTTVCDVAPAVTLDDASASAAGSDGDTQHIEATRDDVANDDEDNYVYQFHALHDFRVIRDDEGNDVDQVEVEWEGGVVSWHDRSTLESEDNSTELRLMARWNSSQRTRMSWKSYRRAYYHRGKFTAGESKLCGFVAVKTAFDELGYQWASDELVAVYIASGRKRKKKYKDGVTWPQLFAIIKFMNRKLGRSRAHPNPRRINVNLRKNNEEGRQGVMKLTQNIGVYLVGFTRADFGHFCVVRTRRSKERLIIDEMGTFSLEDNTWMDFSVCSSA